MDTRPDRGHVPTVIDDVIAVMLSTGSASVVGKDPNHGANRKFRRRPLSAGAPSQNAMLLIGVDHDQIGDRIARKIANHACATGAQHDRYYAVDQGRTVSDIWPRIHGW